MATETLRPTGAGDLTEWGLYPNAGEANWDDVKEVVPDEDATYVTDSGGSVSDLYATTTAISSSARINSVTVYARAKYITNDFAPSQIGFKDTQGEAWFNTGGLTTSYADYNTGAKTVRSDSGAWTWADIDALQIGVKLLAPSTIGEIRVTQVYAVVDYTLPSGFRCMMGVGI